MRFDRLARQRYVCLKFLNQYSSCTMYMHIIPRLVLSTSFNSFAINAKGIKMHCCRHDDYVENNTLPISID